MRRAPVGIGGLQCWDVGLAWCCFHRGVYLELLGRQSSLRWGLRGVWEGATWLDSAILKDFSATYECPPSCLLSRRKGNWSSGQRCQRVKLTTTSTCQNSQYGNLYSTRTRQREYLFLARVLLQMSTCTHLIQQVLLQTSTRTPLKEYSYSFKRVLVLL